MPLPISTPPLPVRVTVPLTTRSVRLPAELRVIVPPLLIVPISVVELALLPMN